MSNIIVGIIASTCAVFCSITITAWLFLGLLRSLGMCQ